MDTLALYTMAQAAQFQVPVATAPISTGSAGTTTPSGGAETFDAVLGYYQCTLTAGSRYVAVVNGLQGDGTVVGDLFNVYIRDSGSASDPTPSSTQIAHSRWECAATGSGGLTTIALAQSFIAPSTGVHTFGVSAARSAGTGTFTPVNTRELYVMYLGTV